MPEKPKRTRSQQSKPGLTQKSLLDIFTAKSLSKPHSSQDQDTPNTRLAQAVQQLDQSSESDELIDITTPAFQNLSHAANAVLLDDTPNPAERRRSPSIIVLESPTKDSASDTSLPRPPMSRSSNTGPSGKSSSEPIVVCSSPIKATSFPHTKPDKPTHPFFTLQRTKVNTAKSTPKASVAKPVAYEVPYPDATSQHVRGFQSFIHTPACPFPPRTSPGTAEPPTVNLPASREYGFLKVNTIVHEYGSKIAHVERIVDSHESARLNIPAEHKLNHPAISRLLDQVPGETHASRRPWSEKWRPTCAQEVLGNEKNAIYLRNWLKALELQLENSTDTNPKVSGEGPSTLKLKRTKRALKRPRVIRAIEKPRGRKRSKLDSDDRWIVHTDEEDDYDIPYQYSSDAFSDDVLPEIASSPPSSSDGEELPPSEIVVDDLGQLHNTILLVGPSGTGKTASVYACAEELGWDVFEVYPGVGRRNGASVDSLVGEVGKNHLVNQSQRHSEDAMKSFLRQRSQKEAEEEDSVNIAVMYSPRKSRNRDPIVTVDGPRLPRQSLILLEEVDILFKEDVNFWNTVTRIIKECKRPVICTCNDISLVPVNDLPLQTILEFKTCPSEAAISYLQGLCRAEGYSIGREALLRLYTGQSEQEDNLTSATSCDLRRAIYGLEVTCTSNGDGEFTSTGQSQGQEVRGINEPDASLRRGEGRRLSTRQSEFLSFLDSELILDGSQSLVIRDMAGYSPCNDDEIGHAILHDVYAKNSAPIGLYDRQEEIGRSAIQVSRGMFDVDVKQDEVTRVKIRDEFRTSLSELCPLEVWWSERGWHYTEYKTYLGQMISGEDLQERIEMEKRINDGFGGYSRNTRNSTRRVYERSLVLTEKARMGHARYCVGRPPRRFLKLISEQPLTQTNMSSRSPVTALASLEYLQNQRRGSITDPSLHAASSSSKLNSSYDNDFQRSKHSLSEPRPASPFTFGDPQSSEQPSNLRKILHSPLPEHPSHRTLSNLSHDSHELSRTNNSASSMSKDFNSMLIDHDRHSLTSRRNFRDQPPAFDATMRRHSIAVGQNAITLPHLSSALGTKRKMSDDRGVFPPVGEDSDTQLVGPGVPSIMDVDTEGPAPKRRGSTIDTQRIAQLSLNDRRNSVDSRSSHWIANNRRDSAPSLFHNVPGISSFNAGFNSSDPHPSRAPPSIATFSWPNASSESTNNSTDSIHHNRSFDSANGQPSLVPPINYPPDRRMSVPDVLVHHPSSSRSLRSRSRPPSRQNTDSNNQSSQEDTPNPSISGGKSGKDSGMTPYSRSPELRVSHKLAERKRRKEMKDLFDELRDQLPADRGMKASKWEILSKAIDFVAQLKRSHQDMAQELELLRSQLRSQRGDGLSGYPPNGPPSHNGFGNSSMGQFPPTSSNIPPLQTSQNQHNHPESRSNSSQNLYPNSHNLPTQNGSAPHRIDGTSP